jgi:hypothetical protein
MKWKITLILAVILFGCGCDIMDEKLDTGVLQGSLTRSLTSNTSSSKLNMATSTTLATATLSIVDESGEVLGWAEVVPDSNGYYTFTMQGDFADKKLRIKTEISGREYYIGIGRMIEDQALNLGTIPLERAALATRYLEYTSASENVFSSEIKNCVSMLVYVMDQKISGITDLSTYISAQDRIAVDNNGNLAITQVRYPERYAHPARAAALWEQTLFEGMRSKGINPPSYKTESDVVSLVSRLVAEVNTEATQILFAEPTFNENQNVNANSEALIYTEPWYLNIYCDPTVAANIRDYAVLDAIGVANTGETRTLSSLSLSNLELKDYGLRVAVEKPEDIITEVPVHYRLHFNQSYSGDDANALNVLFSVYYR